MHDENGNERPDFKELYVLSAIKSTDDEIDLAVLCLNTYGWKEIGHTRKTLAKVDPLYIKDCLIRGYDSELLSYPARKLINKIIDGMEEIAVPVNH